MRGTPWILFGALAAAVGVYFYAQTQSGQGTATDAVSGLVGEVTGLGESLSEDLSGMGSDIGITPRGIRNNNPGNLDFIAPPAEAWNGQVGSDGRFGVYDTPANGVRAMAKQLQVDFSRGDSTLTSLINTWAPSSENDTGAYVSDVAQQTGLDPEQSVDLQAYLPYIVAAIIQHENGENPYSAEDLQTWVYLS